MFVVATAPLAVSRSAFGSMAHHAGSSLLITPLVVHGTKALSKLHLWVQPRRLLLVLPLVMVAVHTLQAHEDPAF